MYRYRYSRRPSDEAISLALLIVSQATIIRAMFREDLSRNFGFLVNDVARLLRTAYDRRIREINLTRAQWWVLTHLYRGNGVTQTELAETLEIEKPTLGRLLDRLEEKGWVRREHDARDRRVWRVHLTKEVEPALRTMRALAGDLRRDALSGLSEAEAGRFVDTLLAIKGNLLRGTSSAAPAAADTKVRAVRKARTAGKRAGAAR